MMELRLDNEELKKYFLDFRTGETAPRVVWSAALLALRGDEPVAGAGAVSADSEGTTWRIVLVTSRGWIIEVDAGQAGGVMWTADEPSPGGPDQSPEVTVTARNAARLASWEIATVRELDVTDHVEAVGDYRFRFLDGSVLGVDVTSARHRQVREPLEGIVDAILTATARP